ncbi:hypothetical protein GCM10009119_31010 [Algoriphagus jejuensis]|uniref:Phage-Barnase-EndoU-ColicinE5/D-RelE like nuclease 2 domain-containing protein n=1 Tax=Algoriphagus jejuensis TaxID=419934 RepID=A0ABN1N2S0_9BACT
MQTVLSIDQVPIRVPDERWEHVALGHPEMLNYKKEVLETLQLPDFVFEGNSKEKIAVRDYLSNFGKLIVVVYRESTRDEGFLITSFLISKLDRLKNKKLLWRR